MRKYLLDTNLYIRATRDTTDAEALHRFLAAHLPATYLHAVVVQELLVGARNPVQARATEAAYIAPFERRRRIVTPTYQSWKRSAEVIGALQEKRIVSSEGYTRSFLNDVLLAVSCREAGVTLVTANLDDFERIRRVERFDFVPPWPEA